MKVYSTKEIRSGSNWEDDAGGWVMHDEYAKLQKELQEVRAQALAAVWSVPEDVFMGDLHDLRREASSVFLGSDKATIAKLQDELSDLQEAYQEMRRPPSPGIREVLGIKADDKTTRYVLQILNLRNAPDGGYIIEVRLP